MRIRLYNARILTMESGRAVFSGEIHVSEDQIIYVADKEKAAEDHENSNCTQNVFDREIDCCQNLILPGFKNAHTHSPMTFLRSFADDLPLQEWLYRKIFPMEAKLDADCIYWFGKLAILEYLSGGITGIFDMYLQPDVMAQVCLDTGFRGTLVSGFNDFTSGAEQMAGEYERWNNAGPLLRYFLGFHAQYTTSSEHLKQVAELAKTYRAPIYTHLSETAKEVDACIDQYGKSPVELLDSYGIFDYGGGGYHCIHFTERDYEIFQQRKLYVVTNPASNLKLSSGIAPIRRFMELGIPVAIGTDGPASNNCLDMFREMFLVSGLAKYREKDAACIDAMDVLRMATVNGAYALGREDCDVIAQGKKADLIMIDLHQPNMQPIHNIGKNLVYSGSKSNVKMTMIGGKILYYDGNYRIGDSPETIYRECERCLNKIQVGR